MNEEEIKPSFGIKTEDGTVIALDGECQLVRFLTEKEMEEICAVERYPPDNYIPVAQLASIAYPTFSFSGTVITWK